MPRITIRLAMETDLPKVLKMAHALARHHGDTATLTLDDLRRDTLGDPPWVTVLVAERLERMVGYAALCPLTQMQFGVRGMDLHHLFVDPAARGTGVGRALISASLAESKKKACRFMTVGTHPDNKAAAQVYRSLGFETLPAPGPRFRMKWDLD